MKKRFLAAFLALIMVLGTAMPLSGMPRAMAASNAVTVTYGELVASNYDLTQAEKDLLNSGLLAEGSYSYATPDNSDGLITVDTENGKITAATFEYWVPTTAYIVAGGETKETIILTEGKGDYDKSVGNAFSVKVDYVLKTTVAVEDQQVLLDTMAALKQGVTNLKTSYDGSDANLGTVVLAMDTLEQLAAGISMSFGSASITAQFKEAAKNAVEELAEQVDANGGSLNLQVKNTAYNSSASKNQYLVENGAAYRDEVISTYNNLKAISDDGLCNNDILDQYLASSDPAASTKWSAFKGIIASLVSALEPVAAASWNVPNAEALKTGITAGEYQTLDTLVAALGDFSTVTLDETLEVATTTIQANLSMFDVTVTVALKVVEDKVDSAVLETYDSKTVTVTVAEGATTAEILAEIEKNGVEADAIAAWGSKYQAEHYEASATTLPETLTEDIGYTITYAPKNYAVTYGYTTDAPTFVPYGYQLTLPKHESETKAYDYEVNGTTLAQGTVYTVTGNTTISREVGKSYTFGQLYAIIGENYGNVKTQAILKSGALLGDESVAVRYPDDGDVEQLLDLDGNTLTAATYDASYNGLSWVPYSYGVTGTENLFNGATEVAWTETSVKVIYRLTLTDTADEASAALELAANLADEAVTQKAALDKLANYSSQMAQLNKTALGALNGVIDVTDLHTDAEKNAALKADFKAAVSGIINNNLDGDTLKIANILTAYNSGGLTYYYNNSDAVINEISSLAGYLNDLLKDEDHEAALATLVSAAGPQYATYADKIKDLKTAMADVQAALTAPNAAIDLNSAKLSKLIEALETEDDASYETPGNAWRESSALTAVTDGRASVSVTLVKLDENGELEASKIVGSAKDYEIDVDEVSQDDIDTLKTAVAAAADELLPYDVAYYDLTVEGGELDSLAGSTLSGKVSIEYSYTAKKYTVKIDGEADQTITVEDRTITLPAASAGYRYDYTIMGSIVSNVNSHTFKAEDLLTFVNDVYTIARETVDLDEEAVKTWKDGVHAASGSGLGVVVDDSDPVNTEITMTVNAGNTGVLAGDLQNVALAMLNGYDYLYIGDELVASNDGTLVVSLQAFVDAILTTGLTSDQLIAGVAADELEVATTMTLKKATVQRSMSSTEIVADLKIIMNSIPDMVKSAVGMLAKADKYMDFTAANGKLNVTVDLPEKVYEVYLAALAMTGNVDLSDINTVNEEIAYRFLADYVNVLLGDNVTSTTYVNTAQKLGYDISAELAAYEQYIDQIIPMIGEVTADANGYAVTLTAQKAVLEGLLKDQPDAVKAMIKELKETDGKVTVDVAATVADFGQATSYEAIVIDRNALNEAGVAAKANVIDCTDDLAERLKTVTGTAAVMLQSKVTDDLTFNGTTILDLNGKTITGNITANGKLVIVDSSLGSNVCGGVTGEITTGADGSVIITGGKYTADVKTLGFLKDGYTTAAVGEPVVNELYTITETEKGKYTVTLNSDFATKPNQEMALALAADLAADLALNFYDAAAMSIDDKYDLYSVSLTDLIDLYSGTGRADAAIEKVLNCVKFDNIKGFANDLLAKALDFDAIAEDGTVATYTVTTNPWKVALNHNTTDNYLDVGIIANTADTDLADTATITFVVDGTLADALFDELSGIVTTATATVDSLNVTYANKTFDAVVGGTANAVLDLTGDMNSDYITVIAVVLANGGNDALLTAVKDGKGVVEQKAAFDAVSVQDVFDALKALEWNKKFSDLAPEGITVNENLEKAYKKLCVAAGWILEQIDVTGSTSTMGGLYNGTTGVYEYAKNGFTRDLTRTVQGYTIDANITANVSLSLKLFRTPSAPETYEVKILTTNYATAWDASGQERYWFAEDEIVTIKIDYSAISAADSSFKELVVTLLNNAPVEVTPDGTNFTFKMPAGDVKVTVNTRVNGYYPTYIPCTSCHCEDCPCERGKCKCDRGCPSADFTDLHEGQWFHASSDYVICRGLMRGIGNNLFDPYGTTTRAMVVTTLYRLEGEPKVTGKATDYYTDVKDDAWYSDAIVWASKKGLAEGYGNNLFGPNDVMTREQIATFFYRYAQYEKLNTKRTSELDAFADADKVSFWAVDGLEWAVGSTLFRGTVTAEGLVLDPRGETDRSQTAALLHRWCEEFAK